MPKVYITNINVCKLYWQCVFGGWGLTRFAHMRSEEHISLTGNHAKDFKGTQVKASAGNLQIFKEIRNGNRRRQVFGGQANVLWSPQAESVKKLSPKTIFFGRKRNFRKKNVTENCSLPP